MPAPIEYLEPAASSIVKDPFLQSVLETSSSTHDQCLALVQLVSRHPVASTTTSTESTDAEHALSMEQKRLYSRLSQLRGQNRDALWKVRETKQETAEARQEVDRLHLQLGNLYYEEKHLRGEVAACESYDHTYQQLPLVPVDEFLEQHPEHADDDEKALMFARINHELAEREALEEQRQGLLKKKQSLIADNKKRKDDLASLDRDLEKFIDAAKPIMKTFEKHT